MKKLAMEYRRTADGLASKLKELDEELSRSRGRETFDCQRRIETMQQELAQVLQVMRILNTYYDPS